MRRADYDYVDALRALIPLRLAEHVKCPVVLSAIIYSAMREERALLLCRQADGSHRMFAFYAKTRMQGEFESGQRRDINVASDFDHVSVAVDGPGALLLFDLWKAGVLNAIDQPLQPDMDYVEVGMRDTIEPVVGLGFRRYGQFVFDTARSPLLECIYDMASADGSSDGSREGILRSVVSRLSLR